MKKLLILALAAGAAGCGSGSQFPTFDLEKAIDNPRAFDIGEIATDIEFIPLDDSRQEALVGEIISLQESRTGFYIFDDRQMPVKMFDRNGKFIGTRGTIGRGPNEMSFFSRIALDTERDRLYILGGAVSNRTIFGYDAGGNIFARVDSIRDPDMAFLDDRVVVLKQRHEMMSDNDPAPGTPGALLDILSPDLLYERSVESADPGAPRLFFGGAMMLYNGVMSDTGQSLLVKEGRCDTVFVYRGGVLSPSMVLDAGRWAIPDGVWGQNATVPWSKAFMMVNDVMEGERYLLVLTSGGPDETASILVFDRAQGLDGFSALGPDGKPGMSAGGVQLTPMYVRSNRLVGYMSALNIVDARDAGTITNPQLKTLAATLKEDSNPLIVIATLKR